LEVRAEKFRKFEDFFKDFRNDFFYLQSFLKKKSQKFPNSRSFKMVFLKFRNLEAFLKNPEGTKFYHFEIFYSSESFSKFDIEFQISSFDNFSF